MFSLAILSYGPGFIPTPDFNDLQYRLDVSNTVNKLAWRLELGATDAVTEVPPVLLKKPVTANCEVKDKTMNKIGSLLTSFAENVVPNKPPRNMNKFEREGWHWLIRAVKKKSIMISSADKGNAVVIVTPAQMLEIQMAKLSDGDRYLCLNSTDPTPALSEQLHSLWCQGVTEKHVTRTQAKKTVGIQLSNGKFTKSTSDIFKPGLTYGYALLKVHKLSLEQIRDKKIPPTRFVSDLSRGLTVRSDKFLAWNWIKDLARDYATDLVQDSTHTLQVLESFSGSNRLTDNLKSFNFDVVSLYDSLSPQLVLEAFSDAVSTLGPTWSPSFVTWIKNLISLSLEAAFVSFRGIFYKGKSGIPTRGTLSVELANIAVRYVLRDLFNRDDFYSQNIVMFVRFVDDGAGILRATDSQFVDWFNNLNSQSQARFNLSFTYSLNPITEWTIFLDIKFKYLQGNLHTDINIKETDACRYLEFSSHHPRHTFSSIIYSQAIRYRRIIKDNTLLHQRLDELKSYFASSSYDEKLIDRIIDKVRTMPRILVYKKKEVNSEPSRTTYWTCTYGPGFIEAKNRSIEVNSILGSSNQVNLMDQRVQVVPRRAPNLKNILFKRKAFSMNPKSSNNNSLGNNMPCGRPRCMSCTLIGEIFVNGVKVDSEGGTCTTVNCIYLAQCQLCYSNNNINRSNYVGKCTTALSIRISGHRAGFNSIVLCSDEISDKNCLWAHLTNTHGKKSRCDFNKSYRFCILKTCDPKNLRFNEQFFIEKLGIF